MKDSLFSINNYKNIHLFYYPDRLKYANKVVKFLKDNDKERKLLFKMQKYYNIDEGIEKFNFIYYKKNDFPFTIGKLLLIYKKLNFIYKMV